MSIDTGNLLDKFTTAATSTQPSLLLPAVGGGIGALRAVLRRGYLPGDSFGRSLLRKTLLGGLTGTGLELMRLGTLRAVNHLTDPNTLDGEYYTAQADGPEEDAEK